MSLLTASRPRLAPVTDRAIWDRVAQSMPGATAFHTWDVLELTEQVLGVPVQRLAIEVDGEPVGVWPLLRPRGAAKVTAPPFPYLGPLVPDAHLPSALAAFRSWQLRERVLVADFDLPPGHPLAQSPGVASVLDATVVVDLGAGERDLQDRYSRTHRRGLGRAIAAGCTVRPALPGELGTLLPALLHEAYAERGIASPYPVDAGAVIEAWSAGRDDVSIMTALVDGEPAGVLVMLASGPVHRLWLGGCLRRFRDARPNLLLHHAQLARSQRRGAASVDLVGAVDDGVRAFKLGFGGRLESYVRAQSRLGPAPLWRAAQRVRALTR